MRNGQVGIPLSPDYRGADGREAPSVNKEMRRCRAIKDGKRCNTILSRYNNGSDLCFACSEQQARGAKLELAPDDRPKKAKGKKGRAKKTDVPQNAATTTPTGQPLDKNVESSNEPLAPTAVAAE